MKYFRDIHRHKERVVRQCAVLTPRDKLVIMLIIPARYIIFYCNPEKLAIIWILKESFWDICGPSMFNGLKQRLIALPH